MANQLFSSDPLPPLTIADLNDDASYLPIPEATLQLQVDTLNVIEGRLPLSSFPPERQEDIKNYYRFSADFQNRRSPQKAAQMTPDTLDLI